MRTIAPGTAIGPYVIEHELARGGMGAVYRARRSHDGAVLALKLLHAGAGSTAEQRERFRREAQLAAALVHPGIVRVHDAGDAGALSYIAMDLIEGEALAARVGRLAPLEAAGLVAQVARAIEYAHARGVIHRDLKPGNVLLRRDDGRALVTDFGVARHVESAALTRTGAMVGTPTYLSPEQAGGLPATTASDVHALGAVLFEAVTGLPPFRRDDLQSLLVAITTERPEAPGALTSGVPRALDRACLAALAKSSAARPTAGALAAELEAIVEGRTTVRPRGRTVVALALVLALVLVLALALVLVLVRSRSSEPEPGAAATAPRPGATTTAPEAAWSEPAWLRDVAARGDAEALVAAHEALDALEPTVELDARTRARALVVLADLDRRWRAPAPADPGRTLAGDRLAWIHWLWRRVDPGYVFPSDREALLETHVMDVAVKSRPAGDANDAYVARAGRATMALQPHRPTGYLLYASGIKHAPWSPRAGPLLRAGLAVAEPDGGLWGVLARQHARWLDHHARAPEPAGGAAARDELLVLARAASARTDLVPGDQAGILVLAAGHAAPDEAAALLARAEEAGPAPGTTLGRARWLVRRGDLDAARRQAEDAGAAAVMVFDNRMAIEAYTLAAALHLQLGRPARALENLERALANDAHGQPGAALRRVLLLLDTGDTGSLGPALDDLAVRLAEHLERQRAFPDVPRADIARLEAALADARAAASEPGAPDRVGERLRRWGTPEALALLER